MKNEYDVEKQIKNDIKRDPALLYSYEAGRFFSNRATAPSNTSTSTEVINTSTDNTSTDTDTSKSLISSILDLVFEILSSLID